MAAKKLGYSGVLFEDRRRFYPNEQMIARLYPSVTPFLSSLIARGGERTPDKDYKMFEHRAAWRYQNLAVNAATPPAWSPDGAPGGTAAGVTVDNVEGIEVDSSLVGTEIDIWNSAGDTRKGVALVTGADASNQTVDLKAIGNPSSATQAIPALADDDQFYVIGTAYGEGAEAPAASSDNLEIVQNSVQRDKTSVEVTEDLRRAVLRGARDELARLRNEKQNEHKIKMARSMLFGMRVGGIGGTAHGAGGGTDAQFADHVSDASGRTVSTTMGIVTAIERYGQPSTTSDAQNFFAPDASTYGFGEFVDDMEKIFQYDGEGMRTAYCGSKVLSFFSKKFVDNTDGWGIEISGTQTNRLGFNYRMLETPHGMLRLVRQPLFRRTPYDSAMLLPDEKNIKRKMYAPMEYRTNIKTDNAPDVQKDVIQSWEGLCLTLMETHALFRFSNL